MKSNKRHVVGAVVTLALGFGAFALPLPAMAASTCKGSSCEGKDPVKYGCTGDGKLKEEFTDTERFRLIYSAKCDAVWTNVIAQKDHNTLFGQVKSYDLYTKKQKKVAGVQVQKGSTHTTMLAFHGQWTKACDSYDWFNGVAKHCTDYY